MSQYLFSLLIFVTNNRDQFFINSEILGLNTVCSAKLHLPRENLNIY